MKTILCALTALCAKLTVAHSQTVFDDFNGTTVDPTKWTVSTFGSGSVTESGGFLNLMNKGRITSVAQYPDELTLEGRFVISGAAYDQLSFVLRTDGAFNGPFGESSNGIFIQFNTSQNPDGYNEVRINDVTAGAGYIAQLHTTLNVGTLYDFKIVDTGNNVSVYLTDLVNPALSAATSSRAGNTFDVYNREIGGSTSQLDYLRSSVPEPASGALVSVGIMLYTLRRRN